jgi:carboxypeptidase D
MSLIISEHSMLSHFNGHFLSDTDPLREHLCKYDLNLTYPQNGYFPTLIDPRQTVPPNSPFVSSSTSKVKTSFRRAITQQYAKRNSKTGLTARAIIKREEERRRWTRDLTNRPNGTLDPWYGCFLWEELMDYAVNFTFPWSSLFVTSM